MKNFISCCLFVLFVCSSCIEAYDIDPTDIAADARPLYIEGHIISGGNSSFFVTQATAIGPSTSSEQAESVVDDATVTIESDAGFTSDAATYEGDGLYVIPSGTLNDLHQYRVVVKARGETFVSAWQHIMPSVPIKEVNFFENEYANAVDIRVSTTAPDDAPRHYLYTYEENWEIESKYDFHSWTFRTYEGPSIMYDAKHYPLLTPDANPYLHCWKHRYSTNIQLYSTAELESNTVKDFVVRSIPARKEEISVLYAIDVHQSVLSDEAYDYYRNMEHLTENTGGLFSPTPYHYRGNISCTTHPDIEVYGYVTASASTMYRYILNPNDLLRIAHNYSTGRQFGKSQNENLDQWKSICLAAIQSGHVVYAPSPETINESTVYFDRICFDCFSRGGTKDKPTWWPNDHE